jgi:hypothetical protein
MKKTKPNPLLLHLHDERALLRGALERMDAEIRDAAAALEKKQRDRIATDGGLQEVERLIEKANAKPANKPKT